jgi:hypothetical protein
LNLDLPPDFYDPHPPSTALLLAERRLGKSNVEVVEPVPEPRFDPDVVY